MKHISKALVLSAALSAAPAWADHLNFHVFNPQENSIFPVTSVIVEGDKELLLVDAQFQKNDAEKLVSQIRSLGKPLKTIYISHFDPDFYFGLDTVSHAFPNAKIIATPETVKHIDNSVIGKYRYWSPIMKENAPKMLVLPQPTEANYLTVGSSKLMIKGKSINPSGTYLWDADSKTVLGGALLYQGMHLWLADSQTKEARSQWRQTLSQITALRPKKVIAGHFIGETGNPTVVKQNQAYLQAVEQALPRSKDSKTLSATLQKAFPHLKGADDAMFSAKVLTGEETWPK